MSEMDNLEPVDEISIQQILYNLLDGDENLDLKTQINKPKELASLIVIAKSLKERKYLKSYNTLKKFIEKYLRYMVSYNRKSRIEIIQAISHPNKELEVKEKEYSTDID